jgi:hypothetical protein
MKVTTFFGPRNLFACLLQHLKLATNPAHEEQRFVFRQQCGCPDVDERNWELKAIICFVDEVTFTIVNEMRFLVLYEFSDGHRFFEFSVFIGLFAWIIADAVNDEMGKGRRGNCHTT